MFLQRLFLNTGWVLAERLVRYTVGFLVGIWVARYLGPDQYGALNYALAFVTVLAFMSTLGLDALAVRDMVRDPGVRDETIATLVAMRLVGGVVLLVAATSAVRALRPDDPVALWLVAIVSLAHLVQAFDAIDCWFQSAMAYRFSFMAKATAVVLGAIVRVSLIVNDAPLVAFAWAILIESTLLAAGMLVAYRRTAPGRRTAWPRWSRARALVAEGWPLMLTACVSAVYLRIDQVILGQLASFAEVGAYAVAARVVEVSYIIPAVLTAAVFPAMVRSREADVRVYEARIQRLFDAVIWLAIVVSVSIAAFAPAIVHALVGRAYADAVPALAVLAWMPVWVFFGMLRQRWLIAENELHVAMSVEVLGCILNVLCNLLLIPRYGAVGAATAAVIAAAGSTLLLVPFVPSIRRSLRMFLSALLAPLRIVRAGVA